MIGRLPMPTVLPTWALFALLTLLLCLQACQSASRDTHAATLNALTTPEPDAQRQRAMRRLALASAYFEQNQDDAALQEARAALQIDGSDPQAFNLIGLIHQRAKAPELAQTSFEQALRLASQSPATPSDLADVQHNFGWFLCQQDLFDLAQAQLIQAVSQVGYRQAGKSWMAMGLCQLRAGQKPQARESFESALKVEPANTLARYQLALLVWQSGDARNAQIILSPLNTPVLASPSSLWLGVRLAHVLAEPQEQRRLAQQLTQSFPNSTQALSLSQGKFNEQ